MYIRRNVYEVMEQDKKNPRFEVMINQYLKDYE
jgi:hypothetical protein